MIPVILFLAVALGALALVLNLRRRLRDLQERYEARLETSRGQMRYAAFMLQYDHPEEARIFDAAELQIRTGKMIDVQAIKEELATRDSVVRARIVKSCHYAHTGWRADE